VCPPDEGGNKSGAEFGGARNIWSYSTLRYSLSNICSIPNPWECMFEASQPSADRAPTSAPHSANVAPKRDRRLTLTKIDKRGRLGKRVRELTAMFASAVGGEQTPMRKLKVEKAAELTALAELARGDFMRDGKGTLDDIVRLERKADQAVRALGIREQAPKPTSTHDNIRRAYPAARLEPSDR
jgi:hypothetical protein